MSVEAHLESLKAKHAALELTLQEEEARPLPDQVTVHDLKRRKLEIKDQIETLRH